RHIADVHRRAPLGLQHDLLEIRHTTQIAPAAHHVLALTHLDDAAADIPVAGANALGDLRERNAEGPQLGRIDHDLVLLDEAADTRDLGDTFGLVHLITAKPLLHRPQFA